MAASTANVPLPCKGTHSWLSVAATISSKRPQTRPVMRLKSASQEPQSRSMLCLVRSEVVKGPGVRSIGSAALVGPGGDAECELAQPYCRPPRDSCQLQTV